MQIKQLFDPSRDIHRSIEKVITYAASQEARLKAEISEYIVTENIEDQFESLLSKMQAAMEVGGPNEVGVWVSGFYGSGKSSFTKYMGLALDSRVQVDGQPFLRHLQDRLNRPQTKALLNTVASRYPAAVIMLDLASEMVAGATMEEVSTVLYYKVLQEAGYSRNLKVAALERRLQNDGRYDELTERIERELGVPWREAQNDPLVIDSLIPEIAHEMYPHLFRTPNAFGTETGDFVRFETDRVREMIEIVRQATGKEHIVFIIDEVGQYVASRQHLILNLDGLAKNLKELGDGKVWIIGTAQQTLTEDDPRAALNTAELYRLAARFPVQIDLESSDIKEICYRRLLGKSPEGQRILGDLFDRHGPALRHSVNLQDARFYDSSLDRTTFINLYPFLPAHFDILLHLLGALAKSTGGIGLRSAIKVIQDILVDTSDGRAPISERPLGSLATTVTLYDALERDIRRAFPSLHNAVSKAMLRFHDSAAHQEVAKTVAVLQILDTIPVTVQNIASLMHPALDAPARRDEVDAAVSDLSSDPIVPFGEQDGSYRFFSEKLNDIDQERAQIPLRTVETRRIQNEALREALSPLPSVQLNGSLTVTSGLRSASGGGVVGLAGERETVQTIVEFVEPAEYEDARARLVEDSRQRGSQNAIYLLGRSSHQANDRVGEIYRCQEIAQRYRSDPDQEVREYCTAQADRAARLGVELQHILRRSLAQGSFIFRGQATAVEALDRDLLVAARKHLSDVAERVFERYAEAPARADTSLAERFLRVGNLRAMTTTLDPLGLVQVRGGVPHVATEHKALTSVRDHIDRNGTVEGRRLIDHFTGAPFGWSQDTLRYLVAALLVGGEIKLRVSGREVTANGQQAIDALRTNVAFKSVGVALRDSRPSPGVLARAAQRLTELSGEQVIPLEDEISRVAVRCFPLLQQRLGPLGTKLQSLGLPGVDSAQGLVSEIADVLVTDGSDAPDRLGGEQSSLYDDLRWAMDVDRALNNGLGSTVRALQHHRRAISDLPAIGVPGQLRQGLSETLALLAQRLEQTDLHTHAADLRTTLTEIQAQAHRAVAQMAEAQVLTIRDLQQEMQRLPEWLELSNEEQAQQLSPLDDLVLEVSDGVDALQELLNHDYTIRTRAAELKREIERLGHGRQLARRAEEREKGCAEGRSEIRRTLSLPARVQSTAQLDQLIQSLQALRSELASRYDGIDVTIQIEG